MTKEEFILDQYKRAEEIRDKQVQLIQSMDGKTFEEAMLIGMELDILEVQRQTILSQPYPKYPSGGMRVGGMVKANTGEIFDAPVSYDK